MPIPSKTDFVEAFFTIILRGALVNINALEGVQRESTGSLFDFFSSCFKSVLLISLMLLISFNVMLLISLKKASRFTFKNL